MSGWERIDAIEAELVKESVKQPRDEAVISSLLSALELLKRPNPASISGKLLENTAHVGGPQEGLNAQRYAIKRSTLVDGILDLVLKTGYAIIKAPSQAGKTSTCQLVVNRAKEHSHIFRHVHYSSMLRHREDMPFNEAIRRECGVSFDELWSPRASPDRAVGSPSQHQGMDMHLAGGPEADTTTSGGLYLLVIDEAQDLYRPVRNAGKLWSALKSLGAGSQHDPTPKQLRIVIALMYGTKPSGTSRPLPGEQVQSLAQWQDLGQLGDASGHKNLSQAGSGMPDSSSPLDSPIVSPMDFGEAHTITMHQRGDRDAPTLHQALSEDEFLEIVCRFKRDFHEDAFHPQSQQLLQLLYRVTSGLPGPVLAVLGAVANKLLSCAPAPASGDKALWHIMTTSGLWDSLTSARSFVERASLRDGVFQVFHHISWGEQLNPLEEQMAEQLVRQGVLWKDSSDRFQFASELHRLFFLHVSRGRISSGPRIAPNDLTLPHFVRMVSCRLDGRALAASMGIGKDGRVPEAVYQHQFFKAATEVLPAGASISPNVGPALGSSGYVDFVFSSQAGSWAVELLRDGSDAAAHAQRFADTGIYAPMMGSIDAHCLIDFRGPNMKSRPKTARQNFWYVSFEQGFTYACVTEPGDGRPERFRIHKQS